MTTLYHSINSRQLTTFQSVENELIYHPDKNYLFDLSYLAAIEVRGEHSQEYLQGQLSCDVRDVSEEQIRQGALCNLKGRILALVDVVNWHAHGFHLILPADLLVDTQASLAKTAMFSRVTLSPANNYQTFGFYLQNHEDVMPFHHDLPNTLYSVLYHDNYCCYCLGNNFYVFLIDSKHSQDLCEPFITKSQFRGSLAWHALQLQQKRIEIYPDSRGIFLPHRLGLQLSSYLNFNKGCYKGQEIIARTHYRAKLKHELKLFTIETDVPLKSGLKLLDENENVEVGELVDYCPLGDGKFLIAASVVFETPSVVRINNMICSLLPLGYSVDRSLSTE